MPLSDTAKATPSLALCAAPRRHRNRDAALLGEFHRIVDQVFQRRAQPDGIADHQRRQLSEISTAERSPFAAARPASESPALRASARRSNKSCRTPAPAAALFAASTNKRRKAREMFGAGLDGVDPAPLALVEVGRRQEIADRQDAGQRRAHLMRERGERGLDDAGSGRRGGALGFAP